MGARFSLFPIVLAALLTLSPAVFAFPEPSRAQLGEEPIQVQAGARFRVVAHFDNSAKNPHNPFSPPRRVTAGGVPGDEMCVVFLGGACDTRLTSLPLSPHAGRNSSKEPRTK